MKHQITFIEEACYMSVLLSGTPALDEVRHGIDSLLDHPQWEPGRNVLADTRRVSYEHLTASTIRDFAGVFKQHTDAIGDGKWAIVVRGKLGYGLLFQGVRDLYGAPGVRYRSCG